MLKSKKVNSDEVFLGEESQVKFKTAGNTREVVFSAGVNIRCPIQNISKDKYVDKKTGEIKERKKTENRYQSPKSVRKSINRLMDLIRCNAIDPAKCKWLTLTYAGPMTDGSKVFSDGKKFFRRLQSYLDKRSDLSDGQKAFKRIAVAEPQGEGHGNSWHLHILLIFEDVAPFIPNEDITELWKNGMTHVQKVYDSDGLALYYKVHLSDMEYEESDEDNLTYSMKSKIVEKTVNGESKKFIKGERLKHYPTGMPLYSASRGMPRPIEERMTNKEAMERVKDCKLVYRETFSIGSEDKNGNLVDKRYYKKNSDAN